MTIPARRIEQWAAEAADLNIEVARLRGILQAISKMHLPDQPAESAGDELSWAKRHIGLMRKVAFDSL